MNIKETTRTNNSKMQISGTWITENNDRITEIQSGIESTRKIFAKIKIIPCSKELTIEQE